VLKEYVHGVLFTYMKKIIVLGLLMALMLGVSTPNSLLAAKPQEDSRVRVLIAFDKPVGAKEQAVVRAFGGEIKHSYTIVNAIAAEVPEAALFGLSRNPRVTLIEADGEVQAFDAELDNTWGVKRIGAGTVQGNGNLGTGVKVAIIDSGIDYTHPDLAGRYAGGYDFVNNDTNPMDDNGHGTHVAGSVAAIKNGVGVVGVGPEISLYGLKVLDASGSGSFSNIIAALEWAVANGIQVTNNSYGSASNPGTIVENAFKNANANGVLSIAAAGNSGNCSGKSNSVGYPAQYASVVAVAATNKSDGRPCFSSTGPTVELAAPGVAINSTKLGGGYVEYNGTSMASPHVAGVAALVIAAGITDTNSNGLINDEVRKVLSDTAEDLGVSGRDTSFGWGLVSASAAVAAVGPSEPTPNILPTANAGPDQTVVDSNGDNVENVTLNGSGSFDPDGSIVLYEWYEGATLLATGVSPTLPFALGTHTVTLVVTDNDGATASDTVEISVVSQPSGFILSTTGYKVKGVMRADLSWSGSASGNVDVYRKGVVVATTANDGAYTDNINQKGSGSFTYKLCEAGTEICSNESTVSF